MFDPGARHRDHRRIEAAGRNPDQYAKEELKLPQARRLACADQSNAQQHAAGKHNDAGAEPVGQRAPEERRESHGEEIDRRRRRDAAARPAHRGRNRLQEYGEREHRTKADAGHQRAGADDDPAIRGIGLVEVGLLAHAFPQHFFRFYRLSRVGNRPLLPAWCQQQASRHDGGPFAAAGQGGTSYPPAAEIGRGHCNFLLEWPYFALSSRECRLWRNRAFC